MWLRLTDGKYCGSQIQENVYNNYRFALAMFYQHDVYVKRVNNCFSELIIYLLASTLPKSLGRTIELAIDATRGRAVT